MSLACTETATASAPPTAPPTTAYNVEVIITTDDNPGETSWTITAQSSPNGSPLPSQIVSPTYTEASTDYSDRYFLDINNYCFLFKIVDSGDNGFAGSGSYDLLLDGQSESSGSSFTDWEQTYFGACTATD